MLPVAVRSDRRIPSRGAWLAVVVACLVTGLSTWARADYVVVDRRVSVKAGPSAASSAVRKVEVGQVLPLAEPDLTNNYYHVEFPPGEDSWIYKGFVTFHEGPAPGSVPAEGGTLKVHVINVGQGDAILITCPDGEHQVLIDTGDFRYPGARAAFQNAMAALQAQDDPIEVVIASHPHSDHIGTMEWFVRKYRVGLYVDNGQEHDSATYRNLEEALVERGVNRRRIRGGEPIPTIDFCSREDVTARLIVPVMFGRESNPNENSLVVRIDYSQDSFLFAGDAEYIAEEMLQTDPTTRNLIDCDFLKVSHHGSETSSIKAFLDAVTPRIAAVSAGMPGVSTNAGYKHPRRSTIERLLRYVDADAGPARLLRVYDTDNKRWTNIGVRGRLYSTSEQMDLLFESTGDGITFRPGF
jgi:competence protein ComEC